MLSGGGECCGCHLGDPGDVPGSPPGPGDELSDHQQTTDSPQRVHRVRNTFSLPYNKCIGQTMTISDVMPLQLNVFLQCSITKLLLKIFKKIE